MTKKKTEKVVALEQWVEIKIRAGKTVTTLYPSNAELRKIGEAMDPQPQLVYRRLNFESCVPAEYSWTTNDFAQRRRGGSCIQRLSLETWLFAIAEEENDKAGHLHAAEVMPRPKSRGGCECPTCKAAERRLGIED